MAGVLTDLHAADVRYHVDCRASFMCPRSVQAAARQSCITDQLIDTAFNSIIMYLTSNKATVYSSVDLYTKYVEEGGKVLSRRKLVTNIIEEFGGDVISLSSPGIATILAFKATAAKLFHMIPDDTDDMCDMIEKVSKKIKTEINNIEINRKNYYNHVDKDICFYFQSNTLTDILSKISEKLKYGSLPSLLIGNIITSVVKSLATPLQIALAVELKDSKEQVKTFYNFGVTCSYDELLRFKKSVAFNANAKLDIIGLKKGKNGLIQGVCDNFDQQICSQNGKIQTHSMALLMTHSDDKGDESEIFTPRLSKSEMTQQIPYVTEVGRYTGPKKPIPPESALTVKVPTLATLAETAVILNRVKERDLEFLKNVHADCPEHNGYNTKKSKRRRSIIAAKD